MKRTATEAAMIQDSANSRAQDRLGRIEDPLARIGERIISLMQQFITGDQVARIVTMPGKAWVPYDVEYIQGQFDFEVAAGSTEPKNETFRRQSAMQLVDASMPFLEMGVANPQALYMHILQKGFGVKDVSTFIMASGGPPESPGNGSHHPNRAGCSREPPEWPAGPPMPPGQCRDHPKIDRPAAATEPDGRDPTGDVDGHLGWKAAVHRYLASPCDQVNAPRTRTTPPERTSVVVGRNSRRMGVAKPMPVPNPGKPQRH